MEAPPLLQRAMVHVSELIEAPECFALPSEELALKLRKLIKLFFDAPKTSDEATVFGRLDALFVDGLDPEQIWEELQMRNKPLKRFARRKVHELARALSEKSEDVSQTGTGDLNVASNSVRCDEEDYADFDEDLDDKVEASSGSASETNDSESIAVEETNEQFFDWDDMNRIADDNVDLLRDGVGDMDDESRDGSEVEADRIPTALDLFSANIDGDDDAQYEDFFDDKENSRKEDYSEMKPNNQMSSFERRQAAINAQIAELEEQNVQDREWHLTGEVKASDRPKDSLLSTHVETEMADKQPELITEEVTASIEDLIKQRIRDNAFDDVERKLDEKTARRKIKLRPELSAEKSDLGLADVYEREYVEKTSGLEVNENDATQKKLTEAQKEIAALFGELCYKLDSLSNFHFTPKPPSDEVIVHDESIPAIRMEEVIPLAVSAAQAQAPEEVYKRQNRDALPFAEAELTREERKRRRRHNKERGIKKRKSEKRPEGKNKEAQKIIKSAGRNIKSGAGHDTTEYAKSRNVFAKMQSQTDETGTAPTSSYNRHKGYSATFKM